MAQVPLHRLDIVTGADRGNCVRVAQIVKACVRPANGSGGLFKRPVQRRLRQVEILRLYGSGQDTRNLMLKVTDPQLLAATGGIVQGMSGSPIIQNGKMVGAVTHVLIDDPPRGYGIFMENMLKMTG